MVSRLRRTIRAAGATVVHAHSKEVFFIALWAARLQRCRFVYSVHTPADAALTGFWLRQADSIVAATGKLEDFLKTKKRLGAPKLTCIPTGVDLEYIDYQAQAESAEEIRSRLNIHPDRFLIGNIAPLTPEEDQLTLLKAMRKLLAKKLDAELVLLGKGPMQEKLAAFIQENRMQERVRILPEWENLYTFQKSCDCLIWTTFGYERRESILTASVLGKPVIATKIGSHEEIIIEGKTGYLVPCGFPERIDTAVMRLKATPALAGQIGGQGRAFVEEHFSLESMATRYGDVYRSLLGIGKVAV